MLTNVISHPNAKVTFGYKTLVFIAAIFNKTPMLANFFLFFAINV